MNNHKQIDQHTQDLINAGIDGELSISERTELDEILKGSAAVRDLNDELTALTGLLEATPEREPPEYLQQAIISNVRLPVAAQQDEKQGLFATWLPTHWLKAGAALAAGAVLTIAVYEMDSVPMTAEDTANMVGTVVPGFQAEQGVLIDSIRIDNDLLNGVVELRVKDDIFILDVQLNSEGPTEVNVDMSGRGLEFEGITRMQDLRDNVSVVNGSLSVASSGAQHYALKLRGAIDKPGQQPAPLKVGFFANNTLVEQVELSTSKQ